MNRLFFLLLFLTAGSLSAEVITKTGNGRSASTNGVDYYDVSWTMTVDTVAVTGVFAVTYSPSVGPGTMWPSVAIIGKKANGDGATSGIATHFGGSGGGTASYNVGYHPDVTYYAFEFNWFGPGGAPYTGTIQLDKDPQSVTITPTAAETPSNVPKSFTASGGHNGYIWNVDGGAVYTITLTGGGSETISVTGDPGEYSIAVYSPEGGEWSESNVATATLIISDDQAFFVKVNETNMTKHTLRYRVLWKGTVLDTFTLAPGQVFRNRYQVDDATPGTIEYQIAGTEKEGEIWVKKDTESSVYMPGNKPIPTVTESVSNPPAPATDTDSVVDGSKVPKKPTSAGGIWQSINGGNKDNSVTSEQMAEGIDKLISELQELKDMTEGTPVEGEGFPGEAGEGAALPESANADAMVDGLSGLIPSTITLPTSVGQNGIWSISVPVPYLQSGEIDISMDLTRFGTAVSAFRAMLLACECIVFFYVSVSVIRGAFAS